MRNSIVPISFPKGDRFYQPKPKYDTPFYNLKDAFEVKDAPFKKGFGFGHSARKVFDNRLQ
jgi:hypothetical protein